MGVDVYETTCSQINLLPQSVFIGIPAITNHSALSQTVKIACRSSWITNGSTEFRSIRQRPPITVINASNPWKLMERGYSPLYKVFILFIFSTYKSPSKCTYFPGIFTFSHSFLHSHFSFAKCICLSASPQRFAYIGLCPCCHRVFQFLQLKSNLRVWCCHHFAWYCWYWAVFD